MTLLKIEFLKIKYGKNKYNLLLSALMFIAIPTLTILVDEALDKGFLSLYGQFFDINYSLIIPVSIGVFVLTNINNEFKNKAIKNFIMSKHDRVYIIISKYIVLLTCSILLFLFSSFVFAIISYSLCNHSTTYFNYQVASKTQIIYNILEVNLLCCIYISAIVAFCLMLGITIKKQGLSILIYLIVVTIITSIFNNLYNIQVQLPRFFFTSLSRVKYLGMPGYHFGKILDVIPCISNIFISLTISDFSFKKYKY